MVVVKTGEAGMERKVMSFILDMLNWEESTFSWTKALRSDYTYTIGKEEAKTKPWAFQNLPNRGGGDFSKAAMARECGMVEAK